MIKASDILFSLKGKDLEVWKVDDEVCVQYHKAYIKDGPVLIGEYGRGPNFEVACDDYLNKIRGKTLVFRSFDTEREEITVLG